MCFRARRVLWACGCLGLLLLAEPVLAQTPLGTSFTYQGQVKQGGNPVNGTCDFQFLLFDAASAGSQVGSTLGVGSVSATNGLFTVSLDFGAGIFAGSKRWLEIAVRCPAGSGSYETLSPRQELKAAPNSLYATAAPWGGLSGVPAGLSDGDDNTTYTAGTGLSLSGTQFTVNTATIQQRVSGTCAAGSSIRVINADGTVACEADTDTDTNTTYSAGSGLTLAGTTFAASFAGTGAAATVSHSDHTHDRLVVGSGQFQLTDVAGITVNVRGGSSGNSITAGVKGATISGGGSAVSVNSVTDDYGTIGGGKDNQAGDGVGTTVDAWFATVAGGQTNTANGNHATVGGGDSNTANGRDATISGGFGSGAGGDFSTVAGGQSNGAWGDSATVAGGQSNGAWGPYSFAAGRRAQALHAGSFVWGDSTNSDVSSTRTNQFVVRASGGVTLTSDAGASTAVGFGDRYRDNGIVAWAKISAGGGVSADFGVASVVKDATGAYTITLDAGAVDAFNLLPIAIAEVDSAPNSAAKARLVTVDQLNVGSFNTFKVYITDGSFALKDNDFVFMVTGR